MGLNDIVSDLRGAGSLATKAITGITDIVESLHYAIVGGSTSSGEKRTRGITGLVYRNVRTLTELTGSGIDILLRQFGTVLDKNESSSGREAALSALNGLLGDYLVAQRNPLAIPMQFRHCGEPTSGQSLDEQIRQSNGRIVILVHGCCMNDLQWNRRGHDHGAALARDLDALPLYLHYNTGLHISENGKKLSELLESIVGDLPRTMELIIVAHSMGGLVARSACHYGTTEGRAWPEHLQKQVFLGTPHHGALLERGGSWFDFVLATNPYSAPFSRIGRVRSSGITDLRYGYVLDEHWRGRDRFELVGDDRAIVPMPQNVACYAIAATTGKSANKLGDDLIGDGLVTMKSALGRHRDASLDLGLPESHQWVGREMNHLDLLNHPEVYAQLKKWLTSG